MTPATAVPPAEFTPYLLRHAALRASLLRISFGLGSEDWDDLRQDLALDCLRRLPKFDPNRGDWRQFVRGVVRNHTYVLAARQTRRPETRSLDTGPDRDGTGEADRGDACDPPAEDFRPPLELSLDTRRVLAGLPEELRSLVLHLAESPISVIRRRTGVPLSQLNRKLRHIRAAFVAAGIAPHINRANGGRR